MPNFDYSKLRGLIRERFGTQAEYAKALGISTVSLSLRLNNSAPFTQYEIAHTKRLLGLTQQENDEIFFTEKVRKTV